MSKDALVGTTQFGENVNLGYLLLSLWKRRWVALGIMSICIAAGFAYLMMARTWYQATTVLVVADKGGSSVMQGQLGSLAALAGLGSARSGSIELPFAVLRSRNLIREFIEQEGLLPVVLGSLPSKRRPFDIRDAVDRFDRHVLRISEDKASGTIAVSMSWTDPEVAATWANRFIIRVNAKLRDQAMADAESNIDYLRKELAAANVAPMQQSVGALLESEMQKLMLARGSMQYAFKVVDPAEPPVDASKPLPIVIGLTAFMVGLFASLALVVIADVLVPSIRKVTTPERS